MRSGYRFASRWGRVQNVVIVSSSAAIVIATGGCQMSSLWETSATEVTPDQFHRSTAPPELISRVAVPSAEFTAREEVIDETVLPEPSGAAFVESRNTVPATMPDGTKADIQMGPTGIAAELPPGRPWPVDSLVGQINGKAIYADDFLKGMADRLIQVGRMADRAVARKTIIAMVTQRFEEEVNNRLIISEAESSIAPEAREGLFQWLRTIQEEEIASRGGTRSSATASLQDQFDMTVEQFLERRKNEALAGDLIRRRIEPRTIVAWRDIERAYERARDEYNPGSTLVIGRIAMLTKDDAGRIEEVKTQFAAGTPFTEVARSLNLAEDGFWMERKLDEKGIDGLVDLREEIRVALRDLKPGEVSEPFSIGATTVWVSLIDVTRPPARSLFEPDVQLKIRDQLKSMRMGQEQARYFEALRSRWISDDIEQMRARLVDIALRRYFFE